MFNGLFPNADTMALRSKARTRSLSAENPTGEKAGGARATKGASESCARDLGVGWKVAPCLRIAAGATEVIADIEGPGAIQSIWMTGSVGRHFILRFYWDDQAEPSVECPMPDFFASAWMNNVGRTFFGPKIPFAPIQSAMVAVNPCRGLNCFWPMPFHKRAKITIENRMPQEATLFYQINYALGDVPEDALYFHAQYRHARPLSAKEDFVILDGVQGAGQYVGTALSVGLNGSGGWWGEGEIKFFMDGDIDYPTICGTGTEDYFGGAYNWDVDGEYTPYTGPYLGMHHVVKPNGLYESQTRFSMYRWHVMDPIRFEKDLRVTIQDLGWMSGGRYLPRRDDMMSVAYWYQTLPTTKFPELPDADELEIQ